MFDCCSCSQNKTQYLHTLQSANAKPEFLHFRIDLNEDEFPPALGWVLSKASEDLIWNKIRLSDGNSNASSPNIEQAQRLLEILKGADFS